MNGETLKDEALCFFGELQTKRPNTVKSKIAEFVKKEDQFRKCVLFKIMRERGGKKQTCWYIYTWVPFSTHVWVLTHICGKKHTCVEKSTQLYVSKCWAFSTHVWEKPMTCLFPPELPVKGETEVLN